ncbi:MAG TPA: hypothetical protein VER08_05995 [Pyrinomonadaceae bacterium]|nr:hypothetical protein [Pyrinomonadaceae bacterium]
MTTPEPNVDGRYRVITFIWVALLVSVLLHAFVGYMARGAGTLEIGGDDATLLAVFAFLALTSAAGSFVVRRALLLKATQEQRPDTAQTAYIVGFAVCEAVSLFGVVALFTTGSTYAYLLLALGFVLMLLHKPGRDQLAAAGYRNRSWN